MLVRALNAHPNVRCFGEVFNSAVDFVPFEMDGYDNFSARDRALRVVHLHRRNLLHVLVSLKIAEATGVWAMPTGPTLSRANIVRALRHPLRASAAVARRLRRATARTHASGPPVRLSIDECARMFRFLRALEARSDEMFAGHPRLDVYYEDLVAQPERFDDVLTFLSVEPRPFAPLTQRQNPQPLRELLANYDELRAAFAGTEHEGLFEE